jgi:hypothetical protein
MKTVNSKMVKVNLRGHKDFDMSMMQAQGILIESLTKARDMIKETFKQMIDSVPFNLDRAKSSILATARGICKRVIAEMAPVFETASSGVKQKYGKNHKRVLRNLDKLGEREAIAYAIEITMNKLLECMSDKTIGDCFEYFNKIQENFSKQFIIKGVREIADKACTEIAGMAYNLIGQQWKIEKQTVGWA